MASIVNRNGIFYAQFYDKDRSPQRKRVSLKTKDKSTARQLLTKWERLWLTGEADPWQDDLHALTKPKGPARRLSLSEAFDDFLRSRREMRCTEATLRTYQSTVGRLIRDVGEEKPLQALIARRLRGYIHASGIKPSTAEKRYRTLRTFLSFQEEGGQLKENPISDIAKPKLDKKQPVAFTPEELTTLCEEIKTEYRRLRSTGRIPAGRLIWRINAYWFSFLTGLRRAEIARLRWSDVDLNERTITLRQQKSRKEERLPISKKAASILRRMPNGDPNGYVFKSPYCSKRERNCFSWGNCMTRTLAKYRDRADVRSKLNFHALRKGFCSQLAKSGASAVVIKRAARHADIQTSMIYVEMHDDSIRGAIDDAF